MARGAVKAKQAQALKNQKTATRGSKATAKAHPHGRKRHASGGNPNQQLFFSRMRRRAKPMYFILAVLFAITFACLGVGTGSNSGLDQLFSNLNIFGSSGTSVSKAQKEVDKHPNDPKGFRDLATAYESKGETPSAITALQQYVVLRPKSTAVISELAGLQLSQAQNYVTQYQAASQDQQLAAPSQSFRPDRHARHGARDRSDRVGRRIDGEHGDERPLPEGHARVQRRDRVVQVAHDAPADERRRAVPARPGGPDRRRHGDRARGLQGVREAQPQLLDGGSGAPADQAALARSGEEVEQVARASQGDPFPRLGSRREVRLRATRQRHRDEPGGWHA